MSTAREFPLRVLLGVGDREIERRLTHDLPSEGVQIVGRCLDGPSLLRELSFEGSSVSSRRVGDKVYLVLRQPMRWRASWRCTPAAETCPWIYWDRPPPSRAVFVANFNGR